MDPIPSKHQPHLELLPAPLLAALREKHLPALDGLRAIGAFLVVFFHCGSTAIPGGLGVLLFFVVSGFLITWLLLQEQERTGQISLSRFYWRRTLRIFPAFYVYWALVAAWGVYRGRIIWPQAWSSFFYVNNYYQAWFGDPNTGFSHTWSLGIEEQFYLIWPAAFVAAGRVARFRLARGLAYAVIILWLYRWFLHFVVQVNQGYIYEAFDARADHLLIGCGLAVLLRQGLAAGFWRAVCGWVGYPLLAIGGLVASSTGAVYYGTDYRNVVGFVLDPVLVAIAIPGLMAHREHPLLCWMSWSWVRYLGTISYSTYLYQQLTPSLVEKLAGQAPWWLQVMANTALVIVVASGSYYLVEKPFLRIKDRLTRA